MTDQQYTPTTEEIRNAATNDTSDWKEARAEFDRWLSTIEAAAEQRGAARGYDEGRAHCIYDFDLCEVTGTGYGCGDCSDCIGNNPYRADLLEDDDE